MYILLFLIQKTMNAKCLIKKLTQLDFCCKINTNKIIFYIQNVERGAKNIHKIIYC